MDEMSCAAKKKVLRELMEMMDMEEVESLKKRRKSPEGAALVIEVSSEATPQMDEGAEKKSFEKKEEEDEEDTPFPY